MTIHSYFCPIHGEVLTTNRADSIKCQVDSCPHTAKRNWRAVQLTTPSFTPHFNTALGKYVSNDQEFRDGLKLKSEENSQLTGTDHSYQPIYPGEFKQPDTHTEALENQLRSQHDAFSK